MYKKNIEDHIELNDNNINEVIVNLAMKGGYICDRGNLAYITIFVSKYNNYTKQNEDVNIVYKTSRKNLRNLYTEITSLRKEIEEMEKELIEQEKINSIMKSVKKNKNNKIKKKQESKEKI